jgi:hypothetical protein
VSTADLTRAKDELQLRRVLVVRPHSVLQLAPRVASERAGGPESIGDPAWGVPRPDRGYRQACARRRRNTFDALFMSIFVVAVLAYHFHLIGEPGGGRVGLSASPPPPRNSS